MPVQPHDPSRRRFLLVTGILALAAAVTLSLPLLSAPIAGASYAKEVRLQLGDWSGVDRPVDADTIRILQTDDIVNRHYVSPDQSWVDLTIIFAKEQRKVAHPQEICLKGAGYNIQDYSRPTIPVGPMHQAGIPVVKLRTEHGRDKYLVYYWYKCADHYTSSYYWENMLIIWSQVTLRPANGALIKLTTPIENDIATSEKRLADFLGLVMPEISSKLP